MLKRVILIVLGVWGLGFAGLAAAACTGSVTTDGCTICVLHFNKRYWVKTSHYYTDENGDCKTIVDLVRFDCGTC